MPGDIELIPYYDDFEKTLNWYSDKVLCMQMDGKQDTYDIDRLRNMYSYLCKYGECFYISYMGELVGDITLLDRGEIAIAICKDYQNKHIGRRAIELILELARQKGFDKVYAKIYSFNIQSQKAFEAIGFSHNAGEIYTINLKQ